jgi:imidazolonepropionase-like amidohydrolase
MLRPVTDYTFPMIAQGMADIIAEGGYGAIGSHGQHHGIGAHWEMWMVATAMTPMQTLEVATMHGARFLGLQEDLGSLERGKLADLLVLNTNPLDDIRNTADIQYVMKAGTLYEADSLNEIWPTARPYGAYPWLDADMLRADDRPVDYWDRQPGQRQ